MALRTFRSEMAHQHTQPRTRAHTHRVLNMHVNWHSSTGLRLWLGRHWLTSLLIHALLRQHNHLQSDAFIYQITQSLTYALSHFPTHSLIFSPMNSLTKSPNRLHTLSVTSPHTHSFSVPRIHLPNHPIACLRSQSLTHTLTHFQSHEFTYQITQSLTYALSNFLTHSLISVPRIHLPNHPIACLRSQSLSHTLTQLQSMHSLTKWPYRLLTLSVTSHTLTQPQCHTFAHSNTHQSVNHSSHLFTRATHPFTHTHSLKLWPVI